MEALSYCQLMERCIALEAEVAELRGREPVADVVAWSSPNEGRTCDIRWRRHDVAPGPLYTAGSSLVSAPISFEEWSRKCDLQIQLCDPQFREKAQYIWNACRAAMLHGGK